MKGKIWQICLHQIQIRQKTPNIKLKKQVMDCEDIININLNTHIQTILIIRRFVIYESAYLLQYICNLKTNTHSVFVDVDMCRVVKNLSCPIIHNPH